ncbi:MAG TPA: homoserine kinase [Xanthomonadales bacterium]|nr:homoserine kinase [Xanthomonadales bacterium]
MYTSFFGLNEKPFAITPDPRYLYLSERHTEALAHLAYGISEAGGFVQLTGEVGTGKTTISRLLLEQLPEATRVAMVLHPKQSPLQLLETIAEELHIELKSRRFSNKLLVDALHRYLLDAYAAGLRVVLLIDEAQNLSVDALEQVRLLTNLETATQKLLQIILIGQPELREVLSRPELRQLAQRITGRYHLESLRRHETIAYVRHRLRVAGATRDIFTTGAMRELHRLSGGVPRIINVIADRALLGAYTREEPMVDGSLVRRAASEVYGRPVMPPWLHGLALGGALAGAALLAFRAIHLPDLGLALDIEKGIPLGSGMGGSAASAVAALVAANSLLPHPLPLIDLYPFALTGEAVASGGRHGDNVAPSLLGGLILALPDRPLALPAPAGIHCALVHPHQVLETRAARQALRSPFTIGEITAQSALLARFLIGCERGDLDLLASGLADVLVEPRRASLVPGFAEVKRAALAAGALGASLSGAGPSLFAWAEDRTSAERIADAMVAAFAEHGIASDRWLSPIAAPGARLLATG